MVRVGPVLGRLRDNVYMARNPLTNDTVAMKLTPSKERPSEGVPATAVREIYVLEVMHHENIVRLLDIQIIGIGFFMVFEYMNTDLQKYMMIFPDYSKDLTLIKRFLYQILCGINYCHSNGVIHRNLKPKNLLVRIDNHTVKLADFGFSTRAAEIPFETPGTTAKIVPLSYRAPELLLRSGNYSTAVDMWSIGCIFAEMVNQRVFFTGTTEIGQIFEIFRILSPTEEFVPGVNSFSAIHRNFPETNPQDLAFQVQRLDPDGLDLLSKMLCLDPNRRIDARRALAHRYFTNDGHVP